MGANAHVAWRCPIYYLGTITGSSGACNNTMTGVSGLGTFKIPPAIKAVYLTASATGVQFAFGNPTGISFLTTAGQGAFMNGPAALNPINGPFGVIRSGPSGLPAVVSVYNPGGVVAFVSVNVYAAGG